VFELETALGMDQIVEMSADDYDRSYWAHFKPPELPEARELAEAVRLAEEQAPDTDKGES
jgi:hypothetical protein